MALLVPSSQRPFISPVHQGPLINIISWIAVVTMSLTVLLVLGSKLASRRKLTTEDFLLVAAMFLSAAQTIAISKQTENGLGTTISALTPAEIQVFQVSGYASSLLYVAALVFAKASTLTVLKRLTPSRMHRRLIWAVISIVAAWGSAAFLGSAFQCVPNAEIVDSGKCFNQIIFWDIIGAFDMATDLLIMVCPIVVVWKLQLALDKKAAVVVAFAFRFLAIMATVVRLYYLPRAFNAIDYTLAATPSAIATQIAIFCAIFSSAAPHLRPFMDSMQAGYFSGAIHDEQSHAYGLGSQSGPHYATQRTLDSLHGPKSPRPYKEAQRMSKRRSDDVLRSHSETRAAHRAPTDELSYDGGRNSENSTELMVIKQTKEWSVTVEERTAAEKVPNTRPFD